MTKSTFISVIDIFNDIVIQQRNELRMYRLFILTWKKIAINKNEINLKMEEFDRIEDEYSENSYKILYELHEIVEQLSSSDLSSESSQMLIKRFDELKNKYYNEIYPERKKAIRLFLDIWTLFDVDVKPSDFTLPWPKLDKTEKWRDAL